MSTELHPLLEAHPRVRHQRAREAESDARLAELRRRHEAAQEAFQEERLAYMRALDEGRAGAPPQWHPPVDIASAHYANRDVHEGMSAVLAGIADEAERLLRRRDAELLDAVAAIVHDHLTPALDEERTILASLRSVLGASGRPVAHTRLPSGVTLTDLIDAATAGAGIVPDDLSPNRYGRPSPDVDRPIRAADRAPGSLTR